MATSEREKKRKKEKKKKRRKKRAGLRIRGSVSRVWNPADALWILIHVSALHAVPVSVRALDCRASMLPLQKSGRALQSRKRPRRVEQSAGSTENRKVSVCMRILHSVSRIHAYYHCSVRPALMLFCSRRLSARRPPGRSPEVRLIGRGQHHIEPY